MNAGMPQHGAELPFNRRSYAQIVESTLLAMSHVTVEPLATASYGERRYVLYSARCGQRTDKLPAILVSGGVHGDEPAGVYAALRFLNDVAPRYVDHFTFLTLPCLNPSGFEQGALETMSGANLNRLFGVRAAQPEVRAVEDWLQTQATGFLATFDLHETRPDYRGEGFVEADNPRGCYLYETTAATERRIGRKLIDALPGDVEICREPRIYLDENSDGVVFYPEACHNPVYKQATTFDGYLNGRYTSHSFTTETPTGWPLDKRVDVHLRWLDHALQLLG